MTDITKCTNKDCPLKEKCFRWTAPSDRFRQSYANFMFYTNEHNETKCEDFYNKEVQRRKRRV